MANISNKEYLEIAKNESTSPEQLRYIWEISRSPKVRKAVASNANADSKTLRAAARLYLEEVLENPAFEMLDLFGDDSWISTISKIYASPEVWMMENRNFYRMDARYESFAKTAIISPNCNPWVLCSALEFLPVTALKRTFKHPVTRERARKILKENLENRPRNFSLEGLFKAYNSELINEEELYYHIKCTTMVGSMSCRKSTYTKTFRTLLNKYDEKVAGAGPALSVILIGSRNSCIRWVSYDIKKRHLNPIASAVISAKKLQGVADQKNRMARPALAGVIKALTGLISEILWGPWGLSQRIEGLEKFHGEVQKLGLADHEWGNSKETNSPVMLSREIAEELAKKPIELKTFYAKNKCLGNWFHMQKSDVKFQIIEEVNNHLYETKGIEALLYNEIDLKKIIRISPDVFFN